MTSKILIFPIDWIKNLQSSLRRFAIPLFFVLLAALLFFSFQLGSKVFIQSSAPALNTQISTNWLSGETPLNIMELDPGRFRISTKEFTNHRLQVCFDLPQDANYLMIRRGYDHLVKQTISNLQVSIAGQESIVIQEDPTTYTARQFIPIRSQGNSLEITFESLDGENHPLVIDEIGLYKDQITSTKNRKLTILLFIAVLGMIGIFLHSLIDQKQAAIYGTTYIFVLAVTFHLALLFILFSPEWARDLKINFASGTLQEPPGCNLNYGMHMASNILQGNGPIINGMPPWCRMPGYGFVIALAGNALNLLQMAMNSVLLQVILFASALAFFYWTALRVMSPFVIAAVTTFIAFLPQRFYYLQIESLMPAVILFCAGAGCLFANELEKKGKASFRYHLLLHTSFALWFFLRTDILPAWGLISLFLYIRKINTWKYFLLPTCFVLTIGLWWALFKMPYTSEFCMTTNSIGASMMGGLWEVPHKFMWEATDESIFTWITGLNQDPWSKKSSDFMINEVLHFCFSYPFYVVSLVWHKFLVFAKSPIVLKLGFIHWQKLVFLMVMIFSFVTKYRRTLTFFLGWPILLNVPMFFIFFSSCGRFYDAPTISLILATFPLLLDPSFYQKIKQYRYRTAVVILITLCVIKFGPSFDRYLIHNDDLRYYAPFQDPSLSTLNVVKEKNE